MENLSHAPESMAVLGATRFIGGSAMRVVVVVALFLVAVVLVEGLLFVEDTALLGALLLHELVVHSAFFPGHLFLLPVQLQRQDLRLLTLRRRRRSSVGILQSHGRRDGGGRRTHRCSGGGDA